VARAMALTDPLGDARAHQHAHRDVTIERNALKKSSSPETACTAYTG